MRIAFAADHAGADLKSELLTRLAPLGHTFIDLGGDGSDPDDDYRTTVLPSPRRSWPAQPIVASWSAAVGRASIAASKMPAFGLGSATTITRPARVSSTTT